MITSHTTCIVMCVALCLRRTSCCFPFYYAVTFSCKIHIFWNFFIIQNNYFSFTEIMCKWWNTSACVLMILSLKPRHEVNAYASPKYFINVLLLGLYCPLQRGGMMLCNRVAVIFLNNNCHYFKNVSG